MRSDPRDPKHLEEAAKDFPFAFEHPDTRVLARVLAGECYYRQLRYREAIEVLRDAIVIDRSNVMGYRWLAAALFDIGALGYARTCLQQVVELAPEDGKPHWLLGLIAQRDALHAEAIDEFQLALGADLSPLLRNEVHLGMALAQITTRQYAEARETLSHCDDSAARFTLEAECCFSEGQNDKAKELLAQALKLSPDDLDALSLLGKIHLESGDVKSAVRVLRHAESKHFDDYLVHYKLAAAYRQIGDMEAAEEQNKISQKVQKALVRFTDLSKQAAVEADNAEIRYEMGILSVELNQPEPARRWLQIALSLDPSMKKAQVALDQLGESDQAASQQPASDKIQLAIPE